MSVVPNTHLLDVIVAGAGPAGLSISFHLKQYGLSQLVFERGNIAESWNSQRWNSFRLNTARKLNLLPGMDSRLNEPDGFASASEYADMLTEYVHRYELPVRENSSIVFIEKKTGGEYFIVSVRESNGLAKYYSRQVVIASGTQNETKIPGIADFISAGITQMHASQYRSASELPAGAVLVVGSAQSGCQVAEDLADNNRKVFLSTSMVPRVPRQYRGKDITDWLLAAGFFDAKASDVADKETAHWPAPQLSGTSGRTISLQSLAKKGITILGKFQDVFGRNFIFQQNAAAHIQFADQFSANVKGMVDQFIKQTGTDAPAAEAEDADMPDDECLSASSLTHIDPKEYNIKTIIWATGFKNNFDYIKLPVFDSTNNPIQEEGISAIDGLYFIGLPWLRKRKSSLLTGITEDALVISKKVYERARKTEAVKN